MKSAYELAMERLNKTAPTQKLSTAQKAAIAEIESIHRSKLAEQEIRFQEQIAAAEASGDMEKARELGQLFAREKQKLSEQAESKKEAVRDGK